MNHFQVHFKSKSRDSLRTLEVKFTDQEIIPGIFNVIDPALHASRIVEKSTQGRALLALGYRMYGISRLSS